MSPVSRTRHHRETSAFRREVLAFGKAVRNYRRGRAWTIEEAAEHFGVEPAYVRSIESGRTNPSLAVIVSIAEAFEVRAGEMLLPAGTARGARGRR